MKKVLHIVEPLATGVLSFLIELVNFQCQNYNVYIAYGIRPLTPPDFKNLFDSRVHWIRVNHFSNKLGVDDIKAFFEIRKIVQDVNPDIVHCHSSIAGFLGRLAINTNKRKTFYTPHGFAFLIQSHSKVKQYIYWALEFLAAKTNSLTIACSVGEFKEAQKLSKSCTYVNNGISVSRLYPFYNKAVYSKRMNTVCTSGRITQQKNPLLFNQIAMSLPQMQFIWIGEGEMERVLTAPNIQVTGWIPKEKALEIVAESGFFILPSLWEGLSISLLEAMYLNCICVVSDCVGNRDVIKNNNNGFIALSVKEYRDDIKMCLKDKLLSTSIIQKAVSDIEKIYNTKEMIRKYNELYNNE